MSHRKQNGISVHYTMMKNVLLVLSFFMLAGAGSFAQHGSFISGDHAKIHYQIFGAGMPILIINGGPGMSSEGFIPLAKRLAKNHRAIIYDQRGTGLSTVDNIGPATITMDLMVEDIETLRKHLGYDHWIVLGHSFGGMLAYFYASKYPGRVRAMIQSSSGGMDLTLLSELDIRTGLTQIQQDSLAYYTAKIRNGDNSRATRLKRGEFLAPAYLYNQKYVPIVAERLTQGDRLINSLVWQDLRRITYDTKAELADFAKPVLILQGAEDVVDIDIAKKAHRVLPESELVIMEHCRHYGWLDRPGAYFGAISTFLEKLS